MLAVRNACAGRCINCVRDDFLNGIISADEAAQQIIEKVEL